MISCSCVIVRMRKNKVYFLQVDIMKAQVSFRFLNLLQRMIISEKCQRYFKNAIND